MVVEAHFYTVGIGGQARSGKDTLGNHLVMRLTSSTSALWQRRGFADAVKKIFMDAFGVDRAFVERWKTLPETPPGFEMPVRSCLTEIGDGFRRMRPTVWIDKLFSDVSFHQVVTDVRYFNEIAAIRQHGGAVILVYRPGFENDTPNPSEQELRPLIRALVALEIEGEVRDLETPCDYFLLNTGSIADLDRKVDELVLPTLLQRIRKSTTLQ